MIHVVRKTVTSSRFIIRNKAMWRITTWIRAIRLSLTRATRAKTFRRVITSYIILTKACVSNFVCFIFLLLAIAAVTTVAPKDYKTYDDYDSNNDKDSNKEVLFLILFIIFGWYNNYPICSKPINSYFMHGFFIVWIGFSHIVLLINECSCESLKERNSKSVFFMWSIDFDVTLDVCLVSPIRFCEGFAGKIMPIFIYYESEVSNPFIFIPSPISTIHSLA